MREHRQGCSRLSGLPGGARKDTVSVSFSVSSSISIIIVVL